ncbi:MAG TPA: farnesyl diphosphate synthase [Steroidobacteraceae bacterium]|nr:farnesyl diphosphate synthase [Steroidobacteraceae bacterium]
MRAARRKASVPTVADAFASQLEAWRARMEGALAARLPRTDQTPERLHAAMRYSVLGGGKRVRPILLLATARALGLVEDQVEAAACALELVHVYSLVHDDLPSMDDDDLRRGRPTCHKAYDEATALLVGDALQSLAFELLARDPALPAAATIRVRLVELLARAIGSLGMAGGQAIDLEAEGRKLAIGQIEEMHSLKTGALIRASVMMGAACSPALEPRLEQALAGFAAPIGLAFQIQDDLLDVLSDTATLGKMAGADRERGKPTYPAILGVDASQEQVRRLHSQAMESLAPFGARADALRGVTDWLLARRN